MVNIVFNKNKEYKLILEVLTKIVILIATIIRYIYLDWTLRFKMLFKAHKMHVNTDSFWYHSKM